MDRALVLVVALLSCAAQAYLTGGRCRDLNGRFSLRWSQCSLCSVQPCRCVFANGRLQADCERVQARSVRPPFGCDIGEDRVNGNDVMCCPIVCSPSELEEKCTASFGREFSVGQTWNECSPGLGCCSKSCQCVRNEGRVESRCAERCPYIQVPDGCQLIEPFQNSTHPDCCRIQCQTTVSPSTPEQCSTSFGQSFNEGDSWEECSGGCCSKLCECLPRDGHLKPVCNERCELVELRAGCRIIEPFQNTTHMDCCRAECPGQYPSIEQIPLK